MKREKGRERMDFEVKKPRKKLSRNKDNSKHLFSILYFGVVKNCLGQPLRSTDASLALLK